MPRDLIVFGRPVSRRTVVKGAVGTAAAFGASGVIGKSYRRALAQDSVKAQILAIPGAGNGQPTEADMQKVGELCLGPTKASVAQGEFNGVELRFMGLNNQNLHNFVFRALLKSWEEYTGDVSSNRSHPAPSTSMSLKWARHTKAMSWAKASHLRCPIG